MKKPVLALGLIGLAVLAGCIPSLHGIYTEKDLVFDPALVGVWYGEGSNENWDFTQNGEKTYRLVYTDGNGKTGAFIAHLAKFQDAMFLDFYPEEPKLQENDFYKAHLLPVHTFFWVRQIEPELRMSSINPEWLKNLLAKEPNAIRHEKVEDRIVFTASTEELQAFCLKHLKTEGAYGDPTNLTRQRRAPQRTDGAPPF